MTSVVHFDGRRVLRARSAPASPSIEITLLGCGTVGSALAHLTTAPPHPQRVPVRITSTLVRDAIRTRPGLPGDVLRTNDIASVLGAPADVVVELLGGLEPARSLVLAALERGIPVVTANKSLLAVHGREIRDAAATSGAPLFYEAAVVAGVPFLGTFARRAYASQLTSVVGIANGTTNYVLTRAAKAGADVSDAIRDAQRLGYAEPDPAKDVEGIDAAEKLAVLLQHFALADVTPADVETRGISTLTAADIAHAAELGGTIKPVVAADWSGRLTAFAGPAFVPTDHLLASVDGVENALVFEGTRGRILFRGPGAGPDVTAATVLDDVQEAWRAGAAHALPALTRVAASAPETGWLLSVRGQRLPRAVDIADLLAGHGVFLRRTGARRVEHGVEHFGALAWPATRARIDAARRALEAASGCTASAIRALGE